MNKFVYIAYPCMWAVPEATTGVVPSLHLHHAKLTVWTSRPQHRLLRCIASNITNIKKQSESLITLSPQLSIGAKRVEINEILTMKLRTGRASLLRPLTLFSPTLFLFTELLRHFRANFSSYRGQATCRCGPRPVAVAHSGRTTLPLWPTAAGSRPPWATTVLGHGGWPSRLLSPRPLVKPPWATVVGPSTAVPTTAAVRHGVWSLNLINFETVV
jgi:hypothetical protein